MAAVSIPWAAQKAVVARLKAHFASEGIAWPVLDHPPQNQPMPFVQIGFVAQQNVSGVSWQGRNVVIPVVGWSNYKGQKEAHQINAEIAAALDERERDLVLEAGTCVRCSIDNQSVDVDPDGVTYVASSIVTLIIEP